MTRLLGAIVYNWPLKLAAIALATLLYAGLILSQNAQSRDVSIQIEPSASTPRDTILLSELGQVTTIRYFVTDQSNVAFTAANFSATVDLSQVEPGPQAQSVRVNVVSADPRIQVISADPAFVSVHLEKVVPSTVPVVVVAGTVPEGLDIRQPVWTPQQATVRGAQSDVARVASAKAVIPIDTSAIDIDRDFPLVAVDQLGNRVQGVEVEPPTVHVTMAVFKDRRTATIPISPTLVGTLAPGFEVTGVTLTPPAVTIEGDAQDLATVATARTLPIAVDGRSADLEIAIAFDLPSGVAAVAPQTVRVHVTIRAVTESRNFTAGIVLANPRADRAYTLSIQQALVTIGGSPTDLDRLAGAQLALSADVADLDVGEHVVPLTVSLPGGLSVVAISPPRITVTVAEAGGSAAPSASGGG